MFSCNRHETKQIMAGKADGATRKYDTCPHKAGNEIVLTSKFLDRSERSIPFAKAIVTSVRPGTVGEFRRDQSVAEMDGYPNGEVWVGQMRVMYPGLADADKLTHIRFRITELDRDAGTRPDVEKAEVDPDRIVD
jgi:hypothetical protein